MASATAADLAEHERLRKPPMVLEADSDVVLRALEPYMQEAQVTQPV